MGERGLQFLLALQPHHAGAHAQGGLAPGRAAPTADLSPPPQSPKRLLRLQCEPFPASHPLHQSPRGGTLGGDRPELPPEPSEGHSHPSLAARREGVTWPRSGEEKMGRLPEPQAPSPCPGFRPRPCQGKITRKEQATTGLTLGGQNHANTGQSSIFQINTSARSYQNRLL